ncbi:MAG: hypothetical protein ACK4VZ_07470 [Paracoccaceae bacterium]
MNTNGNRSRGTIQYCVRDPEDHDATTFTVSLQHSRERNALEALIKAGATGCSFYDDPAPRWASSIHLLRKRGIQIDTEMEPHGGDHPGKHARYSLRSVVVALREEEGE